MRTDRSLQTANVLIEPLPPLYPLCRSGRSRKCAQSRCPAARIPYPAPFCADAGPRPRREAVPPDAAAPLPALCAECDFFRLRSPAPVPLSIQYAAAHRLVRRPARSLGARDRSNSSMATNTGDSPYTRADNLHASADGRRASRTLPPAYLHSVSPWEKPARTTGPAITRSG